MKIRLIAIATLLSAIVLFSPAITLAAVAFDASSNGFTDVSDSNTLTVAHTTSGSNRALVVFVYALTAGNPSVTYNGVSMTKVASVVYGATKTMSMFVLSNPTSGANNIVVSKTSSYAGVVAMSFTGAHQTTASLVTSTSTASGSGSSNSFALTNVTTGDMAVDALFDDNPSTNNVDGSQTKVTGPHGASAGDMDGSYLANGTTMGWTFNSGNYAHVGGSLAQSASVSLRKLRGIGISR